MNEPHPDVSIPSAGGGLIPAYLALPDRVPAPAVVIVPSVFGVDDSTCRWADRYAGHGFVVVVPDLFWRTIPGPLAFPNPAQRAMAMERNARWSVVGYCFGGRYTLIAGAELGANAVVGFHPSNMGLELAAASALSWPASLKSSSVTNR